ncbi:PREDICTED: receptor-like cytosolic serine/threonine-protein kinase RBK1 isoform X2 [Tarenaya hassleriana]|uniref:receptor-like cytosolic serine/threonine-protein kinase RBK1 isoform X2 n=1 Tax=Tarenaya hassleriana TaxID=28532 RepID=UPI00053C4C56|nr:PREDICTED: receptor-like cytosolic serine/threonine-protein kinase RBK1 isoform X2 [Tarenaya hassleriana]
MVAEINSVKLERAKDICLDFASVDDLKAPSAVLIDKRRRFSEEEEMPAMRETEFDRVHEKQRNTVLVGIRMDESGRDVLDWVLGNVTEPGDCVVAVHVCSSSYRALKSKSSLDRYLDVHRGLYSTKKVELKAEVLTGSSVQRVLVKEAKNCKAVAVVVGIRNHRSLRDRVSTARGCAKQLPLTTDVLAIHRGNNIFRRSNNHQLPQVHKMDWSPSSGLSEKSSDKESGFESDESRVKVDEFKEEILKMGHDERRRISGRSVSLPSVDVLDKKPGWPLLRRAASEIPQAHHSRKLSVVHWVMSFPERFPQHQNSISETISVEKKLKGIVLRDSSRWCCYDVLRTATSEFSSENLIGKGGCNKVYKGVLPDGEAVAVKILKSSSKESITDFAHEVSIISSLNHRYIAPLLGVCAQETDLISVYSFSSKGSLEDNLHGKQKGKHVLSWEERFRIAVGLAEALDYLHNRCSRPVIHRDVKSSNVLLSDDLEPRLSDFGLSMWAPTSSEFLIQGEVVGTFGHLAPEYFMYGKAKPTIEKGDADKVLDPNLSEKFDEAQFQRLVLAATLCLTTAATLRPDIKEILKLLRGEAEKEMEEWMKRRKEDSEEDKDCFDDEVYPNSSAELHLSLAMLDVEEDNSVSSSSSSSSSSPGEIPSSSSH